ncbi:hypothetical protein CHLRE_03g196500v5 [Chlamydomonas reinhardtii]|uniref:von Hippel-Lindau disease tumour suppressor beta domain-containing protein n=1 Tax=Chlamydomonas reinhardtii TaxID=3055 RepID=A0A2K3DYN8_CHLRE|nr:uncharacterized protein CHLRE_03g196500v5 [Chlamydomonas reinhardtii]PNW85651.1 hypothetical protein CHLRE_03g196500v5 [Chlamydomonas reinhardtii]
MALKSMHAESTEACVLRLVNKSARSINALWVDFTGEEKCYQSLEPGHARPQQTYTTHVWRLRFGDDQALIGEYAGQSAVLEVQPDETLSIVPWSGALPQPKPEWGEYMKRGDALGIEIWSYACVDVRAIRIAEHIVDRMLAAAPVDVVRRLVAGGAVVAIIARCQVTTDIPAHAFMRWAEGGRDTDTTTRGLGGTEESPTTSCGEENLLMEDDKFYPSENILVHEFGHTVMNIGLTSEDRGKIKKLYDAAYAAGVYDKSAYIMENEDEYWAEGTQAWFNATIRTDVTAGVNTREKLRARDPGLATMMVRAYGDGTWRYPQDSPGPLRMKRRLPDSSEERGSPTSSGGSSGEQPVAPMAAPDVEGSMERVRLAASAGGAGPGSCMSTCLPGGGGTPGSGSTGCGALVWVGLRDVVLGHAAHATVKMS